MIKSSASVRMQDKKGLMSKMYIYTIQVVNEVDR